MKGWHLKREVSAGHLLTTIGIIIMGLSWTTDVESRIVKLETQQEHTQQALDRIEAVLVRIEDKIDQKADK